MVEGGRESFLPEQFIWPVGESAAWWQAPIDRNWTLLYFQVERSTLATSAISVHLS